MTQSRKSRRYGASTMVLTAGVAFFIIPIVGIYVFEVCRYQQIQRQLEKIVDAAALAGGRKMLEADVSAAGQNVALATLWRHWQGMNTAYAFITSQESTTPLNIINSVPLNASNGQPGYLK